MSTFSKPPIPPHILKLQALYHRLPQTHKRYHHVEQRVRNELSGLYGESRLYYPLSKIPIHHRVLQNVRLFLHSSHFQIDFLVITPKFLLILESKYYSSDLMFDNTVHQVIQRKDQQEKVFEDPVLQAEEQAYQLAIWLEKFGYRNLPIEYYVVITNPQTRLKIDPTNNHHAESVILPQRLPSLFRELVTKHNHNVLQTNEIANLADTISHNHQTYSPDILKINKINKEDLLKGVFCETCGERGMKMLNFRWHCPACGHRSRNAHENTLKDYFLLIGPHISNQEFRNFAVLKARSTARDMLIKVSTNSSGKTKSFRYHLFYRFDSKEFHYLSHFNELRNK